MGDHMKRLKAELLEFPSYLTSRKDCRTLTKHKLQQIIDRVISEIQTHDTDVCLLRELNIIAFLYFEIGNEAEAFKYIDTTISKNQRNINAHVLKSWFHLKSGNWYRFEQALSDLRAFRDIDMDILHAEAEMAYISIRLGMSFYDNAENILEKLFKKIEKNDTQVDPSTLCIWKFDFAQIKRRKLNFNNLTERNKFDFAIVGDVRKIYEEILHADQVDKKLKGRVLVELGELALSEKMLNTGVIISNTTQDSNRPVDDYYNDALIYSDSDPYVLNRCGKHFKSSAKTRRKSIKLLRKSLSIRNTPFAHHHLALALKKELEWKTGKQNKHRTEPPSGSKTALTEHGRGKQQSLPFEGDVGSMGCYTEASGGEKSRVQVKQDTGDRDKQKGSTEDLKIAVKCQQKVKYLEVRGKYAESVMEILDHFEKSFEVGGNAWALYDKGLFLRALRRNDEALVVFRRIFGEISSTPLVLLANAYEQSAFCLMDKLEQSEENSEMKTEMACNSKHYLHASIEITYTRIFPRCQSFQNCWSAKYILEEKLKKGVKTKETASELHDFYSKIGNPEKDNDALINLLERVQGEDDEHRNEESTNKIYLDMVRNHYRQTHYDDAILTSTLMVGQMADRSLFLNIHIEGGFQSYVKNENELAKLRLKTALNSLPNGHPTVIPGQEALLPKGGIGPDKQPQNEKEDDENTFEVFILCSETGEDSPNCLKAALDMLGLRVTINSDDLQPCEMKQSGMIRVMKRSMHFVIFLKEGPTPGDLLYFGEIIRKICEERKYGNRVVLKKNRGVQIPTALSGLVCLEYDKGMENVDKLAEPHIASLKVLIQKLVGI